MVIQLRTSQFTCAWIKIFACMMCECGLHKHIQEDSHKTASCIERVFPPAAINHTTAACGIDGIIGRASILTAL